MIRTSSPRTSSRTAVATRTLTCTSRPHSVARRAPRRSRATCRGSWAGGTSASIARRESSSARSAASVISTPSGQLGQARRPAADEGEFLRDAVVQFAGEATALARDRRLGAQAEAGAHLADHADQQDAPGGDAQHVAEVHVGRADGREECVVELGEAGEHDRDRDPAQQRLAAACEPGGGGDQRDPGRRPARSRGRSRGGTSASSRSAPAAPGRRPPAARPARTRRCRACPRADQESPRADPQPARRRERGDGEHQRAREVAAHGVARLIRRPGAGDDQHRHRQRRQRQDDQSGGEPQMIGTRA